MDRAASVGTPTPTETRKMARRPSATDRGPEVLGVALAIDPDLGGGPLDPVAVGLR